MSTSLPEKDLFTDFAWRKPWVGPRYGENIGPEGRRVLILGESHYGEPHQYDDKELTIDVVRKVRDGEEKLRFLTVVQRAVTGQREIDVAFWDGVALANYAQNAAWSRKEGVRPEMLEDGDRAFPELLAILKPTHVVVFSGRVWKRLAPTEAFQAGPSVSLDGHDCATGSLAIGGDADRSCRMIEIWHPARWGFGSPEWWNGAIGPFFQAADDGDKA